MVLAGAGAGVVVVLDRTAVVECNGRVVVDRNGSVVTVVVVVEDVVVVVEDVVVVVAKTVLVDDGVARAVRSALAAPSFGPPQPATANAATTRTT